MGTLDILHPIRAELLSQRYYFLSLLEQAQFCGLLSDTDLSRIQSELLMLLAERTELWSRGKSSSIPVEKAQELMASILFVVGLKLKSCRIPEQAVELLKSEPLRSLFEDGMKLVRRKTAISRHLQKRITDHLLYTPNVYYRSTIVDGIDGFFKLYRPQLAAHELHITADYPVFTGRPELDGIEFIEEYLRRIEKENAFCVCFDPQDIHHLLCGLTQDYRSVPMNLFEPVLLSALGLVLLNRSPRRLDLTEQDIELLYRQFGRNTKQDIKEQLVQAISRLNEEMELPQGSMRYAAACLPKIALSIQNAVMMETLDKVFLIPAYPEQEPKITFSYGGQMDDRSYQKLVGRLLQTDNHEKKVNLILQEVHSFADLLDVFSDAELGAEDFGLLVDLLPPSAFAVLLAEYPNDDFLARESEQLLFTALQERKLRLSADETRQIERAVRALRRE